MGEVIRTEQRQLLRQQSLPLLSLSLFSPFSSSSPPPPPSLSPPPSLTNVTIAEFFIIIDTILISDADISAGRKRMKLYLDVAGNVLSRIITVDFL